MYLIRTLPKGLAIQREILHRHVWIIRNSPVAENQTGVAAALCKCIKQLLDPQSPAPEN
jgi:hypothetical protein